MIYFSIEFCDLCLQIFQATIVRFEFFLVFFQMATMRFNGVFNFFEFG